MSELDVRIVQLEPLRVVCAHGFGESPEPLAFEKMFAYAQSTGLDLDDEEVRWFGFNNPNPSPGSPNYGYEQWITADRDMTAEGDVEIKEFSGGLYAVTRCNSVNWIMATWKSLGAWLKESSYKMGQHQWLEECLTKPSSVKALEEIPLEDLEFDLYCPIEESDR